MAGVLYREQVFTLTRTVGCTLNFTQGQTALGRSFSQLFYLEKSVLLCKVLGTFLELQQLYLCSPSEHSGVESVNSNSALKVLLHSQILPDVHLTSDPDVFHLILALESGEVLKLAFKQGVPFNEAGKTFYLGKNSYCFGDFAPTAFSLTHSGDQDEVCFGLQSGGVALAQLPQAPLEASVPVLTRTEVPPPSTLTMKVFELLKRPELDPALRVGSVGAT